MAQNMPNRAKKVLTTSRTDDHLWYKVFVNFYNAALFAQFGSSCVICHASALEYKSATSSWRRIFSLLVCVGRFSGCRVTWDVKAVKVSSISRWLPPLTPLFQTWTSSRWGRLKWPAEKRIVGALVGVRVFELATYRVHSNQRDHTRENNEGAHITGVWVPWIIWHIFTSEQSSWNRVLCTCQETVFILVRYLISLHC